MQKMLLENSAKSPKSISYHNKVIVSRLAKNNKYLHRTFPGIKFKSMLSDIKRKTIFQNTF